ncbi:urease accessory protein UreD [Wenxinia marina]|uniref:urease accessory protein UreD n=1 Tax=Wenxinia marina TaxID=390641 RepID=UPI001E37653A|nr:urease accessory protein UreD [Wenxinia marina]
MRLSAVPGPRAASVIGALRQEGSLKLLFPRGAGPSLEAVLLNTAGGLTAGDRMDVAAEAMPGAALTLSTQAAERAYRANGPKPACSLVRLSAGEGAALRWLPQETILFDGCALDRTLDLDLAPGARALVAEAVILGRAAMGETVRRGRFRESWTVRTDGRLAFADRLRLEGDPAALLARSAPGHAAFASILLAAPDAAARLDATRAALGRHGGASLIAEGLMFARLTAPDGLALRRILVPLLETLGQADLPKVWRL